MGTIARVLGMAMQLNDLIKALFVRLSYKECNIFNNRLHQR